MRPPHGSYGVTTQAVDERMEVVRNGRPVFGFLRVWSSMEAAIARATKRLRADLLDVSWPVRGQ